MTRTHCSCENCINQSHNKITFHSEYCQGGLGPTVMSYTVVVTLPLCQSLIK